MFELDVQKCIWSLPNILVPWLWWSEESSWYCFPWESRGWQCLVRIRSAAPRKRVLPFPSKTTQHVNQAGTCSPWCKYIRPHSFSRNICSYCFQELFIFPENQSLTHEHTVEVPYFYAAEYFPLDIRSGWYPSAMFSTGVFFHSAVEDKHQTQTNEKIYILSAGIIHSFYPIRSCFKPKSINEDGGSIRKVLTDFFRVQRTLTSD